MDDRQLLEDAARAAGHTLRAVVQYDDESSWYGIIDSGDGYSEDFDPLNDDGDALRLACDLGLRIYPVARTASGQACSAVGSATSERLAEVVDATLDTRTATRRAIVRAAAAIGRQKEAGNG